MNSNIQIENPEDEENVSSTQYSNPDHRTPLQEQPPRTPPQVQPVFNFNVKFCTKCQLVIDERIAIPNPCCNQQNLCANCFMKQFKTSDGTTQIIPTLVFCSTCGSIFQNPLAYNDFLALFLIQQGFKKIHPGFRPQHGPNSPP